MRILLDECVDPRCKQLFSDRFAVSHVKEQGWLGLKNGDLVRKANEKFEVLFTKDTDMLHQTSLKGLRLAVAYTSTHPQALEDYRRAIERLEAVSGV